MSKVRALTLMVIGLGALNLFVLGSLFINSGKKHRPHPPKVDKMLGFDESQQEQFQKLIHVHRTQTKLLQKELSQFNAAYYKTLEGSMERDSLYELIEGKNREIYSMNLNHFDEVRSLCNPEQLKEFPHFIDRITSDRKKGRRRKG